MDGHRPRWALVVLGATAVTGCAAPKPAGCSIEAAQSAEPEPVAEAVVAPEDDEPAAVFEPAGDECSVRLPRGRSGGVLGVEAVDRIHESAEGPLSFALCGCVRPNDGVIEVRATVLPERGQVRAWTGLRGIDRCMEEALTLAGFRPWRLGSDCIDCGPRRLMWPSALQRVRVIEPEPETSVSFPIRFQRVAR